MRDEATISVTIPPSRKGRSYRSGLLPGHGTYYCLSCGTHIALLEDESLPQCACCEGTRFARDSIFEQRQEQGEQTAEFELAEAGDDNAWLEATRATLPVGSRHLILRAGDSDPIDHQLGTGWTRIGRSVAADIRLDDPSVSRRHALIVSEPEKPLRVLDDRSLNGIFLNGKRVEWGRLGDLDELTIGRFRLHVVER